MDVRLDLFNYGISFRHQGLWNHRLIPSSVGPSICVDVFMANQVEHQINSVLSVLPDSKVVSSIPVHGGVKTHSIVMMIIPCARA